MESYTTLVLSLPTRNSTLRMRLWRSLKESGCGVLRDGVYVLPSGDASSLARIEADIRSHGGFARLEAHTPRQGGLARPGELKPTSDARAADIRKLFDRSADYGELVQRAAG